MNIILHAGTPKTGTTSLQLFLHNHRDALLDRGVLYPRVGIEPPPASKHQWMISGLMSENSDQFARMVDAALAEARPDTHTMILSSEGLFHRWWDFSPAGLGALAELAARFPLALWVFFREPAAFARSFYIQMLKNPFGFGPCYGQDISLDEMLDVPRFALHLDYIGYVRSVETVLGAGTVRPFRYDGNTVANAMNALGIVDLDPAAARENRTVGEFGVRLLREINRRQLDFDDKLRAVRLIQDLDQLFDASNNQIVISSDATDKIDALSSGSVALLHDLYGIDF